jgi:hypothetical protein
MGQGKEYYGRHVVVKSRQRSDCVCALLHGVCCLIFAPLTVYRARNWLCASRWLFVVHAARKLLMCTVTRRPSTVAHTRASCVHESEWGEVLPCLVEL